VKSGEHIRQGINCVCGTTARFTACLLSGKELYGGAADLQARAMIEVIADRRSTCGGSKPISQYIGQGINLIKWKESKQEDI